MVAETELSFNPKPPTIMHIDLNSCFATIEQQANPRLRGIPIAVAAYDSPGGCIIAPSIESKKLGIKVGMRVKDGKMICPYLKILQPDTQKYRDVHLRLRQLIGDYTNVFKPKSIDEFELDLEGYPAYSKGMLMVGKEIKQRIKQEIGEWLTVSVGIGPNRFLAKVAANLHKPDGLNMIDKSNYAQVYRRLSLEDLPGIARQNTMRLTLVGVHSVSDFYSALLPQLRSAFHSIQAYYWYLRLRGWEIDDVEWGRKSFGNQYALPKPFKEEHELTPIITKLVEKTCFRLRQNDYACRGVHFSIAFRDGTHWHMGAKTKESLFATSDVYRNIFRLYRKCPYVKPVAIIAVSVFNLIGRDSMQLGLFKDVLKQERLCRALDQANERWGRFVITPARMLGTSEYVPDRIAFGSVAEVEQLMRG